MLQEYKFNYCVLKWTDSEFSKDPGFLDGFLAKTGSC